MSEPWDPALRPLADLGELSVTLTGRGERPPKPEGAAEPSPETPEAAHRPDVGAERERMEGAGFRKVRGVWKR